MEVGKVIGQRPGLVVAYARALGSIKPALILAASALGIAGQFLGFPPVGATLLLALHAVGIDESVIPDSATLAK